MHTAIQHLASFRIVLSLVLLGTVSIGCHPSTPGARSRVTLSSDYPKGVQIKILLVPVKVEGQPDRLESQAVTDALAQRLMEIGYRVIDWDQARSRANELGIAIADNTSDTDVLRVARELGVDGIAKGRLSMAYQPARSESGTKIETFTRTEIKKGTHRKDTVIITEDVPSSYSYSSEGNYYPASQSLSLIAVRSGELWLSASVSKGSYDMTDELAAGIRRAVK